MKFIKMKVRDITIGYHAVENNEIKYTIMQNDSNRMWNIYEKEDILTGLLEYSYTLKEAKEDILRWKLY